MAHDIDLDKVPDLPAESDDDVDVEELFDTVVVDEKAKVKFDYPYINEPQHKTIQEKMLESEKNKITFNAKTQNGNWCYYIVDRFLQDFVYAHLDDNKCYDMSKFPAKCYSYEQLINLKDGVLGLAEEQEKKIRGITNAFNKKKQIPNLPLLQKNVNAANSFSELDSITRNNNNTGPTRTLLWVGFTSSNSVELKVHCFGLIRCPPNIEKGVLKLIDPNRKPVFTISDHNELLNELKTGGSLLFKKGSSILINEVFYRKYPGATK